MLGADQRATARENYLASDYRAQPVTRNPNDKSGNYVYQMRHEPEQKLR
jgi:hypothetical protein